MKLLVLSFYFEPDLSAGSFRTAATVDALLERLPPDAYIDVITTCPNRYDSFRVDVPLLEERGRVTIRRVPLPQHKSGMVDQSRAFLAYARAAVRLVRDEEYTLVYATSSRLMTAVLGSWIARRQRVPLYLDIRDIFVDTMKDVLPWRLASFFKPVLDRLERFAVTRATRVNLVSRGFGPYFEARYPGVRYSFFTNGIDEEFVVAYADEAGSQRGETVTDARGGRTPVALYAGNIGDGQGLHIILPELAERMKGRVTFKVIGDGGRRAELAAALDTKGVRGVAILGPMGRAELIEQYRAADILFLHLNDYAAFHNVLPSKIFEYAATGKPIWAGVAGHAKDFLLEHVENAAVFPPCDVIGAMDSFDRLDVEWTDRTEFVRRFSRRSISDLMAADILDVTNARV